MATKTTFKARTKNATLVTDLASVIRLDLNHANSFSFSLILNETLKLEKTPITNPVIQDSSSSLFSDAFEVFQNNLITIESGNNVFANVMINPSHVTVFSATNLPKKSFAGTSAFCLKNGTQVFKLSLGLLDFTAIIKPAVRCDGEVVYSEVNTQNSVLQARAFGIDFFGECEQEKSPAFFVHSQQAFADLPTEVLFVTSRNTKRCFKSSFDCADTQNIILETSTAWEVITHTATINHRLAFGFCNHTARLFNASNCKLGGQGFSDVRINEWVKFDVISDFVLPSNINTILQTFSVGFDSADYCSVCLNFDFGSCSCLHNKAYVQGVFKPYEWLSSVQCKEVKSGNSSLLQESNVSLPHAL